MKTFIEKVLNDYIPAKSQPITGHPIATYFTKQIPAIIYGTGLVDQNTHLIKGSVGKGNWATVPWICIFDRNITTSATKGVYIVYLLANDGKTLYLTFNQGCTEIRNSNSKAETIKIMRRKAAQIVSQIDSRGFAFDGLIDLDGGSNQLAELYQNGTIFYKAYKYGAPLSEEEARADLQNMMDIYREYAEINRQDIWWPSPAEYALQLTKEDWKNFILTVEIPKHPNQMKMLKAMMAFNGEASCKQLSDTYGGHPSVYAAHAMNIGRQVKKHFNLPACMDGDQERYFPFPFLGKYRDGSESEYIYRIRPELKDALLEIDLSGIDPYYVEEHKTGTFDSWEIIDETTAIKTCDKSFIDHKGSGIPKEICWFFEAEDLANGETKAIKIIYLGNEYTGRVSNDTTDRRRVRIFWGAALSKQFEAWQSVGIKVKFNKISSGSYNVEPVTSSAQEKNAWLLVWNPNVWQWDNIDEAIAVTRAGSPYQTRWSCANSSVNIGDQVYIMVVGTSRNGIVASGYAMSKQYQFDHWQKDRRERGELVKGIDISLTGIVNPDTIPPLSQSILMSKYPDQNWHSRSSGILLEKQYMNQLQIDWEEYLSQMIGGEEEMSTREKVAAIRKYIEAKGFNYNGALIENFYLSLKSKPFVILAGTSGTGKTRLVRLFAEAINAEYKLVSVRPDWSDSSDLFGHVDLNQKFVPGAIIDFVKQAELNPAKPYFLCLDEMNLARVEYYMSDILSAIETRRYENGMIITDPVVSATHYGNDTAAAGRYGNVILPGNLYIVGTVNMDETTFPFSKKVLDRANTIEFSYVDLLSMPSFSTATASKIIATNEFLAPMYITLNDCDASDEQFIEKVCGDLQRINDALKKANAHIGYRVRDEIVFYMLNNLKAELLESRVAFDNQIMQKILPRVQGSSESIKTMLGELLKICESEKYEASAEKIAFMIKRYEEDGFTSYWL